MNISLIRDFSIHHARRTGRTGASDQSHHNRNIRYIVDEYTFLKQSEPQQLSGVQN